MLTIFKNSSYINEKESITGEFAFNDGTFITDLQTIKSTQGYDSAVVFENCVIFPGFCDVHVHFREPGFLYKEDTKTGTMSAARGGYTDVCTMPNLDPVPDNLQKLQIQLDAIKEKALVNVHPYGSLTVGQLGEQVAELDEMAKYAVAFSDDGRGVQSEDMMKSCMELSKQLGKIVVAHCEDNDLLHGGYIHDGEYAKAHNHKGICSESEWGPIKRDIELSRETGCAYHVCHVSTKESVELIRQAKKEGVNITCETAPHYLVFDDSMLQEIGRFKMNPPIRGIEDKNALIAGVLDGTIDMIATDHAPHSLEEKSKGLAGSMMGVVGLETAFPVLYTYLVKTGVLTLPDVVKLLVTNPRERFQITSKDNFTVWKLDEQYKINPEEFHTKGRATPFEGELVYGKNLMTVCGGKVVYSAI